VWTAQTGAGGWGNEELQTYTSDAVALDGKGHLAITAHIGGTAARPTYTSGRITTQGKYEFTNGTLSARIKLPDGPGLLPAFWLLGADVDQVGWPRAGEIDIVEAPHGTGSTSHNIHGPNRYLGSQDVPVSADVEHDPKLSDAFHVFSVTKTPDTITMRIDGEVATELTRDTAPPTLEWVFDQPMNILFSLAIGGKWPGNPTSATPSTSRMLIDWIRLERT
jgi:beta-glucanase (GH16 family)